jgi:hypothetical protein
LLLHLINYPKRTVQSYGKSGKITTFAPQMKQSLSFASCSTPLIEFVRQAKDKKRNKEE